MQRKGIIGLFFASFMFTSPATSQDLGIATGETEGTYYKMGGDIKQIASEFGMNINVIPTEGSLDNLEMALHKQGVQLAIVQSDVLYFISQQPDIELKEYTKSMRIVLPLHNNEVHILASGGIRTFDDLANKIVAIGAKKSGTYLTSTNLFNLSGVKPSKLINIDAIEALEKLRSGEIDAMIYVVGQPAPLFVNLDERLHFVSVTSDKITKYYKPGLILANSYGGWMTDDVHTVTVRNVIMSYAYKRQNCPYIGKLAKIVQDNINNCLGTKIGHPKWRDVDIDNINIRDWDSYECVERTSDKPKIYRSSLCKGEPVVPPHSDCRAECVKEKNAVVRSLCNMACDNGQNSAAK